MTSKKGTRLTTRAKRVEGLLGGLILGLWRRLVKAREDLEARCPRCKRAIDPMDHWIHWRHDIWHLRCLTQVRGWRIEELDPAAPMSAPPPATNEAVLRNHLVN